MPWVESTIGYVQFWIDVLPAFLTPLLRMVVSLLGG